MQSITEIFICGFFSGAFCSIAFRQFLIALLKYLGRSKKIEKEYFDKFN